VGDSETDNAAETWRF